MIFWPNFPNYIQCCKLHASIGFGTETHPSINIGPTKNDERVGPTLTKPWHRHVYHQPVNQWVTARGVYSSRESKLFPRPTVICWNPSPKRLYPKWYTFQIKGKGKISCIKLVHYPEMPFTLSPPDLKIWLFSDKVNGRGSRGQSPRKLLGFSYFRPFGELNFEPSFELFEGLYWGGTLFNTKFVCIKLDRASPCAGPAGT